MGIDNEALGQMCELWKGGKEGDTYDDFQKSLALDVERDILDDNSGGNNVIV